MTDCTLRPAVPADAALLTAIARRSKAVWDYSAEFIEACRQELTWTENDLARPASCARLAISARAVAGFYALAFADATECELEALYVDPPFIGKGIGRVLLNDAIVLAQERSCRAMLIQSDPHAAGFYERNGAVKIGERESGSIPGRFLPLYRLAVMAGCRSSR